MKNFFSYDYISSVGTYLGHFDIQGDLMQFVKAIPRKEIVALGDVVYFMFVDKKLMKIGVANNFAARAGKYRYGRGKNSDNTNRIIMDVMEDLNRSRIDIYCVSTPKQTVEYTCSLTGALINVGLPTREEDEKRYTQMYLSLNENNTLPFCKQGAKKKS